MQLSIPSIVGQMIVFMTFIWFTMKYVWPPITAALEERRQKIAEGLANAAKGSQALELAQVQVDASLKEARAQAQEILRTANQQANQLVEQAKAVAQTEAEKIRSNATSEADRQLAQAKDHLRQQVSDLVVQGVQTLLKREITAKDHADVLQQLAAQV
jgi:F-type H+-transporting ATPase subunit b